MQVTLKVHHGSDTEAAARLVRELSAEIRREVNGVEAKALTVPGPAGAKGDISLADIALTFISSGAAVGLFGVLKAAVNRQPAARFELSGPDGRTFKFDGKNLTPEQFSQALGIARKAAG